MRQALYPKERVASSRGRRVATGFIAAGVVAAAISGWLMWQSLETADWPRIKARIISSDVYRNRSGTGSSATSSYYPDVRYHYQVDGQSYEGNRVALHALGGSMKAARAVAARYPAGATRVLAYDPQNPARAVLEPGALGGSWIPAGVGVAAILFGMLFRWLMSGASGRLVHAGPSAYAARPNPMEGLRMVRQQLRELRRMPDDAPSKPGYEPSGAANRVRSTPVADRGHVGKILTAFAVLALLVFVGDRMGLWREQDPVIIAGAPVRVESPTSSASPDIRPVSPPQPLPTVEPEAAVACPSIARRVDGVMQGNDASAIEVLLRDVLLCKIQRADYGRWKARAGLGSSQPFPEEAIIKRLRTRLAALRHPPSGAPVTTIPRLAQAPGIDGALEEAVWRDALKMVLEGSSARLYAFTAGGQLYIGADVPEERTPDGFDQLRIYLHLKLTPWLKQERVHVGRNGMVHTGRISGVRWPEPPPPGGWPDIERWKRWRLDEGGVWPGAHGASRLDGHRQYELSIPLAEAGISPGVPFTIAAEIETDPLYRTDPGTGKRRLVERRYAGRLGGGRGGTGEWWVIEASGS